MKKKRRTNRSLSVEKEEQQKKMDSESSHSNSTLERKNPRRNRRLQSSDSNESDSSASLMQVDFDALKNDMASIANGDSSKEDPLSLPSMDETQAQTQNNNDDEDDEKSPANCVQNRSDTDNENAENAENNVVNNVSKIKLVPLEKLLSYTHATNSNSQCQSVEISSDSSDQPLADIIKTNNKPGPKRRFSKKRRKPSCIDISSNESDSDDAGTMVRQKPKHKSKVHRSHQEMLSVKVRLNKLPSNLEPLLKQYNLIEIRDRDQNVIVSREKTHRNTEKQSKSKSSTKRLLSDGSSDATDDSVVKLKRNQAKKQKLSDNCEPTTSKRSRQSVKQNKRSDRIKKQKPLRYNISSESDNQNDTNDTDDSVENDKRKMRKKNVPKSSTDVTDSNGASNSEDEIEESKSSESEEDIRIKRKRQVPVKKSSNDDDDDEDYPKPAKHRRRKRIRKNSSSSDDDGEMGTPKKHGRKNIRKVIRSADLEVETKEAAKREAERKKRIEERQKLYNEMYDNKLEEISELDKLVLDFDPETKEELISVDRKLVKKLKPHQGQGVKFMWDACFESIEKINENHGGGCILAHCMGLGKTLQVVALVHTLLTNSEETGVEKVLIICPVSTVLNWVNEFKIWLRHCGHNRNIEIFEISKYKQNLERANRINEWHKEGGVLILGYDMFRNLSSESTRIRKKQRDIFQESLVDPGPDLVVCDEGHLLKNSKTSLSKAVNRIRSLRRIVLTGTPLQNNLNEYYCMVQFVKPNLLGKYNEYLNRFVNPITNGQYTDSTPFDIQMMKRRSHILHKLLDGCVQRRDYSVLAPFLPPKQEYVLYIRMTKLQVDLYKYYMANRPAQSEFGKTRSSILFQDFQNLQRIWTHPRVLRYNSDRYEQMAQKKRFMASDDEEEEGSLKDFIDDEDDEDDSEMDNSASDSSSSSNGSSVQSVHSDKPSNSKKSQAQAQARRTRANARDFDPEPIEPIKEENPTEWWMPLCPEEELNNIEYSGKLMLLFSILAECEACGDKLLVFSQSLFSLDVIEHFLAMIDENTQNPNPDAKLGGFTGSWARGLDYFRLDGSTNIETRNANCISFNSEENSKARLFLISTRAGGLGINLVAANRVIIFDASWNPSHDIQSIFRVYRFGQKKPCYIYRFIALGTMEEKIYERQVTKLAISKRVIDEHQIDRHYKENDLNELYNIENIDPEGDPIRPKLPKDRLFAEQLHKYPDRIWKFHEHDSLLENKSEETLSKEEIEAAWKEFEEEKNRPTVQQQSFVGYPAYQRAPGAGPVTSNNIFGFRTDILLQLLNIKARRTYPGTSNISDIVPMLLKHLYETMEKNDTSFYQELLFIQQTEMAAPSQGSYLTPAGHIMPAYSGRGRPPLNPQNSTVHMQQQHLIQQAQNRLMNINNGNPRLPAPRVEPQVIEID